MEKLDQTILAAIATGPEFTGHCDGENHMTACELGRQLLLCKPVADGFRSSAAVRECIDDPDLTFCKFFTFGFVLAREYYAIKRLEETVFNTVEPGEPK